MECAPLLSGDELKRLIPQREPVLMVDRLYSCTENEAVTGVTVSRSHIFCTEDGTLSEAGLIEHVAQSAAAFAGYESYLRGEKPALGYIGEIRNFRINWLPEGGDSIVTHLGVIAKAGGVTKIEAETRVGDDVVSECQMKIFLEEKEQSSI